MTPSTRARPDLSAAGLHLLAMGLMLLDHLWATVLPDQLWMTGAGRIAYPIFAFLAVEGYFHTHSFRRYLLRLLVFALLSEVPFDLMCNGVAFYPFHQNVLWTFLLSLLLIRLLEAVRAKGRRWLFLLAAGAVAVLGWVLGSVTMVDYYGPGVLTVLVFYLFRGGRWPHRLGQLAALAWLNLEALGGRVVPVTWLGQALELPLQGLALLALPLLWLYRGRQGPHPRPFQLLCYAFYPAHMLLLALAAEVL